MNISPNPTSTFSNNYTVASAYVGSSLGTVAIGHQDYLVIMHCPILSALKSTAGVRMSGLVVYQNDDINAPVFFSQFLNSYTSPSMASVYGGDAAEFASSGFVFASQLNVSLEAPNIQSTGNFYRGSFTLGNLGGGNVSIEDLIHISQMSRPNNRKFSLTSAVVNNDAGFYNQTDFASPIVGDRPPAGMDAEIVDYIVIHKPFVGIETGTKTLYSLNIKVMANLYFRPKLTSSLAYALFKDTNSRIKSGPEIPRDTPFYPEHTGYTWKGLKDAAKNILPLISGAVARRHPGLSAVLRASHMLMD
jgi:hypothetical protein